MKKIVKLTENDISRIVKRVIRENEDMGNPIKCAEKYLYFAFLSGRKGGDLRYWNNDVVPKKNDIAAYKRFIKYLKDVMDTPIYDDEECEGITFDDVAPFIRKLYLKQIESLNEGYYYPKQRSINESDDLPGGIVKRKITDYASAKKYTMGTKVSADSIMGLIEKGVDVFMYTDRSSDKIFIDTLTKRVYDQLDRRIGQVSDGGYDEFAMDYFEDSMNESLNEGYDYPKQRSIGTIKGRKLTLDNVGKYTMGTKISASTIKRYLENGDNIVMYSNGPKRVFVNYTDGKAYNEKDRLITNIKRNGAFDELEDYLES